MKTKEFITWLTIEKKFKPNTIDTIISQCKRIEKVYGDLNTHFDLDKCTALCTLLKYSKEDERKKRPAKNNIFINGTIYHVLASLRKAIRRYIEFKEIENRHDWYERAQRK